MLGEQFAGPHAVRVGVGDGRDDELVRAGRLLQLPQAVRHRGGGRGVFADQLLAAAAEPEVEPSGVERLEETELLDDGRRWASWTPADPSRLRSVVAATGAISTGGDAPATPGVRWCSANQ